MGVVWSCYKYLTQASQARRRCGTPDSEVAHSPEDAQVRPSLAQLMESHGK